VRGPGYKDSSRHGVPEFPGGEFTSPPAKPGMTLNKFPATGVSCSPAKSFTRKSRDFSRRFPDFWESILSVSDISGSGGVTMGA
jgi:hypothetical protein